MPMILFQNKDMLLPACMNDSLGYLNNMKLYCPIYLQTNGVSFNVHQCLDINETLMLFIE